ncbi:MauE/DoxX family redox-associated membrane protein [Dyadobacter sp. 3J3]|uniref:MauE/DoxX family redox-associated membrane protein n=1 Tax=Dyadobacter sp. 3J3 TaxID=2606600 RepID=UPI001358C3DE|nr:MauE/DoxX family redox-associated membrane protein [Dyadobacter sp. 3J3]
MIFLTSEKKSKAIAIITALLVMLFFYTAVSKLLDMEEFLRQLTNQALPGWSIAPLLWLIPISELITTVLLLIPMTQKAGLYASAVLMALFTAYMGLVLLNVFSRVPCSCGGVLRNLDFKTHFLFNFLFLMIAMVGIYIIKADRNVHAVK